MIYDTLIESSIHMENEKRIMNYGLIGKNLSKLAHILIKLLYAMIVLYPLLYEIKFIFYLFKPIDVT